MKNLEAPCRPGNGGCALPSDFIVIKVGDSIILLKVKR